MKKEFYSANRKYEAISAGIRAGSRVDPLAIQVMNEVGVNMNDLRVYFPKRLDSEFVRIRGNRVQRVVMVCEDTCELPTEIRSNLIPEHWKLPATKQRLEEVRGIRDLAKAKVYDLLRELETGVSREYGNSYP